MKTKFYFLSALFLLGSIGCEHPAPSSSNIVYAEASPPKTTGNPGTGNLLECMERNQREIFNSDDITRLVASRGITLETLADEWEKSEPKTPKEVWTAWYVFFHAGRDEAACKMYPLWRKLIEAMSQDSIEGMPASSLEYKRREAAAMLFEPFEKQEGKIVPGRLDVWLAGCESLCMFFCPKYPASRLQKEGWDDDKIITWMKQRVQDVLEYRGFPKMMPSPSGRPGYSYNSPVFRWQEGILNYLRFIQRESFSRYQHELRLYEWGEKKGTKPQEPRKPFDEEISRLYEAAKNDPGNWQKIVQALGMIVQRRSGGFGGGMSDKPKLENSLDLSWIVASASKFSAPESLHLANCFRDFGCMDIAEPFYRRALTEPLTPEESEYLRPKSMRGKFEASDGGMGGGMMSYNMGGGLPYDITEEHVQAMFRVTVLDLFTNFLNPLNREKELVTLREERERLAKEYHVFLRRGSKAGPYYKFVSPDFNPEAERSVLSTTPD